MSNKGIFVIDQWDFKSESFLEALPADDYEMLTRQMHEQVYKKGEIIFREGAYPGGIFYIKNVIVKKYKVAKDGREQIIDVANTGELIGYHAILSQDRFPDSAAAIEESTI